MNIDQEILDLFKSTFESTLSQGRELDKQIQQVKASLYDRNYEAAFGDIESLRAYVVRWSPSRALGYSDLFLSLEPIKKAFQSLKTGHSCRVLSIGGGAGAEIVALASIALLGNAVPIHVLAIDVANWKPVIDQMVKRIAETWYSQHYCKPLDKALEDMSLNEKNSSKFSVQFINHDILTLCQQQMDLERVQLITSMFTTNELFAESRVKTVEFLQSLTICRPGTLFLLVESAGSYSEIKVGTKVFPVQFLIHHALTSRGEWKLVDSDDSRWYRVNANLQYPMKLENMRYFFRLYVRME